MPSSRSFSLDPNEFGARIGSRSFRYSSAEISRAGYYRSLREQAPEEEQMAVLGGDQEIVIEHRRRHGYRRVVRELRDRGLAVNHKRVLRMMPDDNLLGVKPRKLVVTTDSRHTLEVALNLARRMQVTGIN